MHAKLPELLAALAALAVVPGLAFAGGAVQPHHSQAPADAGPPDHVELPENASDVELPENASDAGGPGELPENASAGEAGIPDDVDLPENASVANGTLQLPDEAVGPDGEVDLEAVGMNASDLEDVRDAGVSLPEGVEVPEAADNGSAPENAGPPEDAGPGGGLDLPDVVSAHLPF